MTWQLDDIDWQKFDRSKVDMDLLDAIKAASLVEHNGADYGVYLRNVFHDDPEFREAAEHWASEEVRHGQALARWVSLVEPGFGFDDRFARFLQSYQLPLTADTSVRGSRSGELLSRCVVEAGTSSFYSLLASRTEEPVLKDICRRIAGDEFRHYKLFYDHMKRYNILERVGVLRRLWTAFGRMRETEDDELGYAYYYANDMAGPYDRTACTTAYARTIYGLYDFEHMRHGLNMVLKAAGLRPQTALARFITHLAWRFLNYRRARLGAAG